MSFQSQLRLISVSGCFLISAIGLLADPKQAIGQNSTESNPFDFEQKNETKEQKQERITRERIRKLERQTKTIEELEKRVVVLTSRRDQYLKMSVEVVRKGLRSVDADDRIRAIQQLQQIVETANEEDEYLTIEPSLAEVAGRLLSDDDPRIVAAAIQLLQKHRFRAGVQLGYQPLDGRWEPVVNGTQESELRARILESKNKVEFFDSPIFEAFDEIQWLWDVELVQEHQLELKDQIVKFRSEKVALDRLLRNLLPAAKLDFAIIEGRLTILDREDKRLIRPHLFNVKGLLSGEATIEQLVEKICSALGDDFQSNRFTIVDSARLIFRGKESELSELIGFLGSLAKPIANHVSTKNQTGRANKKQEGGDDQKEKIAHTARACCNRILQAIQKQDLAQLKKCVDPKQLGESSSKDLTQFMKMVKSGLSSDVVVISEIRQGRRAGEYAGLIEKRGEEAIVIVVRADGSAEKPTFYLEDVNSPDWEDYQALKKCN